MRRLNEGLTRPLYNGGIFEGFQTEENNIKGMEFGYKGLMAKAPFSDNARAPRHSGPIKEPTRR
jgi:hypothetical protein